MDVMDRGAGRGVMGRGVMGRGIEIQTRKKGLQLKRSSRKDKCQIRFT